LADQQTRDLEEARQRERKLVSDQKKLEGLCKEQEENIHNLSLNISKYSKSMHDVSISGKPSLSSTPVRYATSAYFPDHDAGSGSEDGGSGGGNERGIRPFSIQTANVSHVTPMPRDTLPSTSDSNNGDRSNLLDNDHATHHSYAEGNKFMTTNYHNYHGSAEDRNMNTPENLAVVRPNATRTEVDVIMPPEPIQEKPVPKKKKKKGVMKVFKMCTGKSGQAIENSKDDMYVKREPARVTVQTYTNESANY